MVIPEAVNHQVRNSVAGLWKQKVQAGIFQQGITRLRQANDKEEI
jgi:hypothetical protein